MPHSLARCTGYEGYEGWVEYLVQPDLSLCRRPFDKMLSCVGPIVSSPRTLWETEVICITSHQQPFFFALSASELLHTRYLGTLHVIFCSHSNVAHSRLAGTLYDAPHSVSPPRAARVWHYIEVLGTGAVM